MVTPEIVVNRIAEILTEQYPACTVYLHSVPASIVRPSFNIYIDSDRSETDSLTLTNEALSIGVIYYAPQEGTVPDELKPLAVYSNIKQIFRKGHIRVGDRSLKVVLIRGGRQDNEIYIIAKLVYVEIRPQEGPTYETVGEINFATKNN